MNDPKDPRAADASPAPLTRRELRARRDADATADAEAASPASRAPFAGASPTGSPAAVPDHESVPTILTVCTGNICRSPMAEVLLRARLGGLGVRVHSAGTHGLTGEGMTDLAQEVAIAAGADPHDAAAHEARYLLDPLLAESDLILTMTREHRSHVVQMMPSLLRRAFTIREFARLASATGDDEIHAAMAGPGPDRRARLQALGRVLSDHRGMVPGFPEDDDVLDPYRRPREVYEEAAALLAPALTEVERVVTLALA
ncbi:low molecular weight phosphatase family protein [Microbacterium capsulatum]|uniref:Low molecular weight phosphatase family protein n=1 Tax=Microbacterium capsulatum TaxID=3041921 RepID=A0ABU0XGN8_9MICO|nr:low molecular weight phosphatase family protein [Microbacterium sp. ASV81]MDQ4214288.1 low molecular weight phosphatase family protein [Microbacterium sp. ASV81]